MDRPWVVVIIDDSFDDREVMRATLEYHGATVHGVASLSDCITLLDSVKPDVIVTDLAMPMADGWAVLATVRESAETSNTRVVAVTAYDSPKLAQQTRDAGFDGYLAKPIDPTTFVKDLEMFLDG